MFLAKENEGKATYLAWKQNNNYCPGNQRYKGMHSTFRTKAFFFSYIVSVCVLYFFFFWTKSSATLSGPLLTLLTHTPLSSPRP